MSPTELIPKFKFNLNLLSPFIDVWAFRFFCLGSHSFYPSAQTRYGVLIISFWFSLPFLCLKSLCIAELSEAFHSKFMFRILFYISHRSTFLFYRANSKWEAIWVTFGCFLTASTLSFTREVKQPKNSFFHPRHLEILNVAAKDQISRTYTPTPVITR